MPPEVPRTKWKPLAERPVLRSRWARRLPVAALEALRGQTFLLGPPRVERALRRWVRRLPVAALKTLRRQTFLLVLPQVEPALLRRVLPLRALPLRALQIGWKTRVTVPSRSTPPVALRVPVQQQ